MHRNVASLESLIYQEISNSYQTFWIVLSDIINVWNLFTTNSKKTFFIITRKNSEFLNKKGAKLTSSCETLLKKIFGANMGFEDHKSVLFQNYKVRLLFSRTGVTDREPEIVRVLLNLHLESRLSAHVQWRRRKEREAQIKK